MTTAIRWSPSLYEDVEPIDTLAADGPSPLVVIEVSDHFREVHGLFYALMEKTECSERVYLLTTEVIRLNSANYTAWSWRRACLEALGLESRLFDELAFTFHWIKASPKNYQVWFHRRWLIDEVCSAPYIALEEKRKIVDEEFGFVVEALEGDAKNYNCFSHRVFLFELSAAWASLDQRVTKELKFTEELIEKDLRNNSAWSYRRQTLKKLHNPLAYDVVADELHFALEQLALAPHNESVWLYVRSLTGWQAFPHVKEIATFLAEAQGEYNRFALQTLLELAVYQKQHAEAEQIYDLLEFKADTIRAKYWRFVRSLASNT